MSVFFRLKRASATFLLSLVLGLSTLLPNLVHADTVQTLIIHDATVHYNQDADADGYYQSLLLSINLESDALASIYAQVDITPHHLSYETLLYTDDETIGQFPGEQLFLIPIRFDGELDPQWLDFEVSLYDAYDGLYLQTLTAFDFIGLADIAVESASQDQASRVRPQAQTSVQVQHTAGALSWPMLGSMLWAVRTRKRRRHGGHGSHFTPC